MGYIYILGFVCRYFSRHYSFHFVYKSSKICKYWFCSLLYANKFKSKVKRTARPSANGLGKAWCARRCTYSNCQPRRPHRPGGWWLLWQVLFTYTQGRNAIACDRSISDRSFDSVLDRSFGLSFSNTWWYLLISV